MDPIFTRIARETSAYYLLGFTSLPSERDGKQHSISVKVGRAGTTVRARPGFSIDEGSDSAEAIRQALAEAGAA